MASVVFAAEKISVIPPWCHAVSSTHVCYYFCLLCTSEAAQPAIGRLWSQPHGAPSVSEAWHCTPALQRQTKTRRSIVTIQEEDRRQNTGMSTPSDLSLSGPPLTPGRGPRTPPPPTPPEDWNRWCNERKAGLAAILFSQLLHLRLV